MRKWGVTTSVKFVCRIFFYESHILVFFYVLARVCYRLNLHALSFYATEKTRKRLTARCDQKRRENEVATLV